MEVKICAQCWNIFSEKVMKYFSMRKYTVYLILFPLQDVASWEVALVRCQQCKLHLCTVRIGPFAMWKECYDCLVREIILEVNYLKCFHKEDKEVFYILDLWNKNTLVHLTKDYYILQRTADNTRYFCGIKKNFNFRMKRKTDEEWLHELLFKSNFCPWQWLTLSDKLISCVLSTNSLQYWAQSRPTMEIPACCDVI